MCVYIYGRVIHDTRVHIKCVLYRIQVCRHIECVLNHKDTDTDTDTNTDTNTDTDTDTAPLPKRSSSWSLCFSLPKGKYVNNAFLCK